MKGRFLYLHSILVLFLFKPIKLIIAGIRIFTFHSGTILIKKEKLLLHGIFNLHSILVLFLYFYKVSYIQLSSIYIPFWYYSYKVINPVLDRDTTFTFHSGTILIRRCVWRGSKRTQFTFHSGTILII